MLKNLIDKRTSLLAEYDALKGKLEIEKRSAYTNEEREAINKIKIDIEEIDNSIALEKDIEAKRNVKLDNISISSPNILAKDKSLVTEFRSFLNGEKYGEKFTIPYDVYEQRATITTSTNTQFKFTDQYPNISVNDSDLILPKLGVKTYYFDSGAVQFPSISQITGTFGTEDSTVSDQTLTSAAKTLTPTFVSASLEVSKVFLKSSKEANIAGLMGELKLAVDKALEKRTIDSMSVLSPIASGATGVTTSFFNVAIQMEAAIVGSPSGYIFSTSGVARAKNSKKDAGSGEMTFSNGYINGYPAVRSSLQTNANHGYLISSSAVAQAYWGEGVTIEMITDATLARKGNVLLIASALADGSYLDANKIAVIKNVNKLS
jgi:hypothetical protein